MNPNKKYFLFFLIMACGASALVSQEQQKKYWIYFKDKGSSRNHFAKSQLTADLAHSIGISERALLRRAKVMKAEQLITEEDLPVAQEYVRLLEQKNIKLDNNSRWFNAVTAWMTEEQRSYVVSLFCVDRVDPVCLYKRNELRASSAPPSKSAGMNKGTALNYGSSLTQLQTMNAVAVHQIGVTGRGVLVGMLDSGFRWRDHEATKNMQVIDEYDFIQKDNMTANEGGKNPYDRYDQDTHGTLTMSVLGGYKEGQLVGPAYGASFILAKTEYVPTETNVEEDNWVAGIEWEEQNGVDVVSSSLGYSEFDAGQKNYSYQDMNGRTAISTKAAAAAARRGVVVCSAMGNEGSTRWQYMTAPADADSILSVGAMSSNGMAAQFSSIGPTSDGRIKPDVCAQGMSTYCAVPGTYVPSNSYEYQQGTSLSTPLVAAAAALLLSAHPELTPIQVRDALRNTASKASSPDTSIGWGMIDVYKALISFGTVISTDPAIVRNADRSYSVKISAASDKIIAKDSVRLSYALNNAAVYTEVPMLLTAISVRSTNSGAYEGILPAQPDGTKIKFYYSAIDNTRKVATMPSSAPSEFFEFIYGSDSIHTVHISTLPASIALLQNYPNPFNPSTIIRFSLAKETKTSIVIYDLLGREVIQLVNELLGTGEYNIPWNASGYAAGVYYYRMTAGDYSVVRSMILLK